MTDKMRDSFEKYLAKGGKDHFDIYASFETWQAATLAERERAAKVCESLFKQVKGGFASAYDHAKECAAAIRKDE